MTTTVLALGGLTLLLLAPLALAAIRHREIGRLAARNLVRRRTEATLVVAGSLLGTAIITSAFVVGDVVDASMSDAARTRLGPIDVTLTPADGDDHAVVAAIADAGVPGLDGVMTAARASVALERPADGDRAAAVVPRTDALALDLDRARTFGGDVDATGLGLVAGSLGRNEVVLNERTASRLDAVVGDRLTLHAFGGAQALTVTQILPEVGLAGYGGALVAPGVFDELASGGATHAAPPRREVLVSLDGGVFDTREAGPAAVERLEAATAHLDGVTVEAVKTSLLDDAERQGSSLSELFGTIGAFSVLAGVLLLVNLFVMLAEERKTELGMLRALGFRRGRLTRAFAFEGALYALASTVAGTVLGVGVGWVVATTAGRIFGLADQGLTFRLVVEPASLLLGGLLGLSISLVTIWATSHRIGRLNVIRAIRDLPEPRAARVPLWRLAAAATTVLAGGAVTAVGLAGDQPIALLVGVPVAAFAAAPLLRGVVGERAARLLAGGVALGWGIAAFPLFGEAMNGAELPVFVVQGVVLTAAAVSLVATLDRVWASALSRLAPGNAGLAIRLGLAYPLARRMRTSLLLGMFSLVIFTMTFIAALSATFDGHRTQMAADTSGGFDVVLDANRSNPPTTADLTAREDIAAAAGLRRGHALFEAAHLTEARGWTITGFDDDLVSSGPPTLQSRDPAFATDAEVWRAVALDPALAIVPDGFLGDGGPQANLVDVGATFTVADPLAGTHRTLTAVAVGPPDFAWNGALVSADLTAALFGPQDVVTRHYLVAAEPTDAEALAARLTTDLLTHGAEAVSFTRLVDDIMRQENAFLSLLQGYLGLGLLVGIAGLGVVMIRAVRERRRQIGMLRAMGFSTSLVRRSFLAEAGLITCQGTAIGMALGLVTVRQVLTSADTFAAGTLAFAVPWGGLVVVGLLPVVAALLATAWPAVRAARIPPAVALRVSD